MKEKLEIFNLHQRQMKILIKFNNSGISKNKSLMDIQPVIVYKKCIINWGINIPGL